MAAKWYDLVKDDPILFPCQRCGTLLLGKTEYCAPCLSDMEKEDRVSIRSGQTKILTKGGFRIPADKIKEGRLPNGWKISRR